MWHTVACQVQYTWQRKFAHHQTRHVSLRQLPIDMHINGIH
jgi:hypothetical protein